ncbi:MAG: type I restriction enzyme HsdR N-terminal domain-containing protein [Candidatus Aenigmarchaeota archaeon]|nr:type I restriction enzyme HsdR N-terminal domain-containing protein [Candidatus Aenigmarchaeota archaeon]
MKKKPRPLKCLIRKKYIYKHLEEEKIRQIVLRHLLKYDHVPEKSIKVEECLTHYKMGKRQRADIVIFQSEGVDAKPWLLYEIKSEKKCIKGGALTQALKYNKTLKCKFICLCSRAEGCKPNKNNLGWYQIKNNNKHVEIKRPKKLSDLSKKHKIEFVKKEKIFPLKFSEYSKKENAKKYKYDGFIGKDTKEELYPLIIGLRGGLLINDKKLFKNSIKVNHFQIKDNGIKDAIIPNASGGGYLGDYRFFEIKDHKGKPFNILMSIFGVSRGYTSLTVGIENDKKIHNSLQLRMDKYIKKNKMNWVFSHDGSMASGASGRKGGRSKNIDVIKFCKKSKYTKNLVKSDKIINLGKIPDNKPLTWDNSKELIINLIRYAIVRDEFRKK